MNDPIKLIFASLLTLLSACSDNTSQKQKAQLTEKSGQAVFLSKPSGHLLRDYDLRHLRDKARGSNNAGK